MAALRIVVLEGDETGQELLEQSLRVLDPGVIGIDAAETMRETGFGIKAATITPEGPDDVGSPNRILREEVDGKVIIRTGRRIPGVTPIGGVHDPIAVCRMAVEDAYGAEEGREGDDGDEVAYRTERVHRSVCR